MRWLLLLALLVAPLHAPAQQPEHDPRALSLALLRARTELTLADSAFARTHQLFDRRLVSQAELEASGVARERAAIAVMAQWVALTAASPRLRVIRAHKARGRDGGIVVRLRVAAPAIEWESIPGAPALPDDVLARLRASTATETFLSVKDEPGASGTAIGVPYEQRLASGGGSSARDFEFQLLRDVEAVVVSLSSGGRLDERKVWLEANAGGEVVVQSLPFSQEADLGAEAVYDLTIERFGGGDAPLRLAVDGLPSAMAHSFTDAETGARIGQLRFAAGTHQRRVRLALSLPPADAGIIAVDSAYRFLVLAAPAAGTGERPDDASGASAAGKDATSWRHAGAGAAELELVTRGVGRVELRAFNLFLEAEESVPAEVPVTVRNTGSRVLDQVRVHTELPPGWSFAAEPTDLRGIAPGDEHVVRLTIHPAPGSELGDYEARLRVDGTSGTSRLTVDPTVIRVRLRARKSGSLHAMLVAAFLATAAGAIVVSRRLGRR